MLVAASQYDPPVPVPPDLDRLLTPDSRVAANGITYVIEPHYLGELILPTGHIVGCDPLTTHDEPFTESVAPGSYPLRAWLVILHRAGAQRQRRVGALQLVIDDAPTAAWTMALTANQDRATLGDDELFCYGVDSGTGTLADVTAIRALEAWEFDCHGETFIPAQIPEDPIEAVISAVVDTTPPAPTCTWSAPAGATATTRRAWPHR